MENILEIGDDKLSDLCPFGDTVFRADDGTYFELDYEPVMRELTLKDVQGRSGQQCHPHNTWDCKRCPKGDVGP